MATRAAARPLRRHGNARVRTAALPASYTISGDTTPASFTCRTIAALSLLCTSRDSGCQTHQ